MAVRRGAGFVRALGGMINLQKKCAATATASAPLAKAASAAALAPAATLASAIAPAAAVACT